MKPSLIFVAFFLFISQLCLADSAAKFPEITAPKLERWINEKKVTIIDANSAETYQSGHIPTAISFAKNKDNLKAVLPADTTAPIVAYCGGPLCTAWEAAAQKVKSLGYSNIRHYKGGIKTWIKEKRTVEKTG